MKDAVIVITGAFLDLGREVAQELARRSAKLVLVANEESEMEDTVRGLREHTKVALVSLDSMASLDSVVESCVGHFGKVDILINAASAEPLLRDTLLAALPFRELERLVRTNLFTPFRLTQLFLPHLSPGAKIVNFSSESAVEHRPGDGGYGVSQVALEHLTRAFALENPTYGFLVVDPGQVGLGSMGVALAEALSHQTSGYRFWNLEDLVKASLTA